MLWIVMFFLASNQLNKTVVCAQNFLASRLTIFPYSNNGLFENLQVLTKTKNGFPIKFCSKLISLKLIIFIVRSSWSFPRLENVSHCNIKQAGTGPSRRHIQGSKIAKRLPSVKYSFTEVENRKFFEKITY